MLDYNFIRVFNIIKSYSSFSKPFLNFIISNSNLSKAERTFILCVKYDYDYDWEKALSEIKKIKDCHDKNLKFLLMMKKLELYRNLGRRKYAQALYNKLREALPYISPNIRDSVIDELIAYVVLSGEQNYDLGKFKMDDRHISDSANIFFEMNKGRKLIKDGNKEGLENFKNALKIATKIHHPSGIVTALNALCWYGMKYNVDQALGYGKEALYNAGMYFEGTNILYVFDTVIEMMNKTSDIAFTEISRDFLELYEKAPENIKKRYKKTKRIAKDTLNNSFYHIDGKTRRFLRKINKEHALDAFITRKQTYNLLHSKVKNIRGDTIRRILKGIDIKDFQMDSLPSPFWIEFIKMKDGLEDGIDAVVNGRQTLDPYVKARLDLEREFLGRIPDRAKENFIKVYLNLDKDERRVIDRFARDYIRYDIRWGIRIEVPDEMEEYVKLFHLKRMPAALAYWSYDDKKGRERLVRVLGSVKLEVM
ncbi:MAG: hypothetical protein ACP5NR_07720 [Athalassotoga sp.]|uniref:hypothetical protein n=1 Tax=Athalassotoga sp. TaxID=2022597 RepID=UPI003CFC1954